MISNKIRISLTAAVCLALVVSSSGREDNSGPMNPSPGVVSPLVLPAIFSDHAVLQRSQRVPVWGLAAPGERVKVSIGGSEEETTAGTGGKWQVMLDLSGKEEGPFELIVQGKNRIAVRDVLIGDVWICSGQSNMEFALRREAGAEVEMSRPENFRFRQFTVKRNASLDPSEKLEGSWTVAGPATSGAFSAAGYYFGKMLNETLHQPVGLIHTSWGGTPVEAWTSAEALDTDADLKAGKDRTREEAMAFSGIFERYRSQWLAWVTKYQRQDRVLADVKPFAAPGISTTEWKPVTLPGLFSKAGLPDSGAVWIRKEITVHDYEEQQNFRLYVTGIGGFDTVYWQGEKVGETSPEKAGAANPRVYTLPKSLVRAGEATLAIRIFNPAKGMGITPPPDATFMIGVTKLSGEWLAKSEFDLPALTVEAMGEYPPPPNKPAALENVATSLYNGMIYPLIPYAFKGVIWYQGEANAKRAFQYRKAFPLMIQDWRKHWKQGDFPFYFCQLANFMAAKNIPEDSAWAELREAQMMTESLPGTGMAVLIDVGEEGDVHPRNKKDVGERLARVALARTYGQSIPYSGPKYQSSRVEGGKIRVLFEHIDGGLVAKPLPATYVVKSISQESKPLIRPVPSSELQGFSICGDDKQWKWAEARIEKDTVVVWSSEVSKPVAVRYAWANNPVCNLYNASGLPAGPFRTDDFPTVTAVEKYQ